VLFFLKELEEKATSQDLLEDSKTIVHSVDKI